MEWTRETVKEEYIVKKWIIAAAALLLLGLAPEAGMASDGYLRLDDVDILHYRIRLEIGETGSGIQGEATILAEMLAGGRDVLPLDLGSLSVDRVTVDGKEASFVHRDGRLSITITDDYAKGDRVEVVVAYQGEPEDGLFIQENKFGHRSVFADNWPNRARHWFPGVDHPYDKATVEFIVTAPVAYDVVANGRMLETTTVSPDRKRTHWKTEVPIPTYCMVVGAARFSIIHPGSWKGIPVSYYLFPGDRDTGTNDFSRSMDMLAFYADLIGPYPYAKLSLVQSSTRFGGMENASAIFFSEKGITGTRRNEAVVAHEIAHQWFGDSVTESDWHHLWLSEGFATYFGALFFEETEGDERFHEMLDRSRSRYFDANNRAPAPIFNPGDNGPVRPVERVQLQQGWVGAPHAQGPDGRRPVLRGHTTLLPRIPGSDRADPGFPGRHGITVRKKPGMVFRTVDLPIGASRGGRDLVLGRPIRGGFRTSGADPAAGSIQAACYPGLRDW